MTKSIEQEIVNILEFVGEDPKREGLIKTPHRVEKSFQFLTKGYTADLDKIVNNAIFTEEAEGMVIARDIEFYSMCEHHLLPFYGKCHVAYLPKGKVIGLSKIPRIVDVFARRLQLQERLTQQVADTMQEVLTPHGVAVIMEATHMCMRMRGVEKQNSIVNTSAMLGKFQNDRATRVELLNLINHHRIS